MADPAQAGRWFLDAGGGYDEGGGALDSVEYTVVTLQADGSHSVAPWQAAGTLSQARAELPGYGVTAADTPVVAAGAAWVYFGSGYTGTSTTNRFEAAPVLATGALGAFEPLDGPSPARVGAGEFAANGWLFLLGGSNRSPSNGNDTSAEVSAPAPTLNNWDALGGGSMRLPRIYFGTAQESAFFFLSGGGSAGGDDAVASVEQTVH